MSSLTAANVNGNYTLAMYDGGAIDIGTLTNWEIEFTYVQGVVASPAVWSLQQDYSLMQQRWFLM